MTWSKTELAQLAREAGEQAVRAAMAGGSGSSQRAPGGLRLHFLGKKHFQVMRPKNFEHILASPEPLTGIAAHRNLGLG